MADRINNAVGNFLIENSRTIIMLITFLGGLYLQHQSNTMKIDQIEQEIVQLNARIDQQYNKLDNVKLDKAVFEATMRQFADMSTDIRSIRERLENMLDKR